MYEAIYSVNTREGREATYADFELASKGRWKKGTLQNSVSRLMKQGLIDQYFSGCAFLTAKGVDVVSVRKVKPTHMGVPSCSASCPGAKSRSTTSGSTSVHPGSMRGWSPKVGPRGTGTMIWR